MPLFFIFAASHGSGLHVAVLAFGASGSFPASFSGEESDDRDFGRIDDPPHAENG